MHVCQAALFILEQTQISHPSLSGSYQFVFKVGQV